MQTERAGQETAARETLLSGIRREVNRNIQLIISLINLHTGEIEEGATTELLRKLSGRLFAIALAYGDLPGKPGDPRIDAATYFRSLCDRILEAQESGSFFASVEVDADELFLDIGVLIPVGLILNELVTNAFLHAFSGRNEGLIHVTLRRRIPASSTLEEARVVVRDDGVGFPEDFGNRSSLGWQLVRMLVDQLGGVLHSPSPGSSEVAFTFPLEQLQSLSGKNLS